MRLPHRASRQVPRGKILLLAALVFPAVVGLMALSTDVGIIGAAQGQLQTVSDAASLAGAMKLADNRRVQGITDLSPLMTAARTQAIAVAESNTVLNQPAVLFDNTANDPNGDVVVGYMDPADPKAAFSTSALFTPLFNSVQVRASRSNDHTGVIPRFFSRIWGNTGTPVTVSSTATVQNYPIIGYRTVNNLNAKVLPIALDSTSYANMMSGLTGDQYSYNSTTGAVTSGADGIKENMLYPVTAGLGGNWGTVDIGVTSNSTQTLASQVQNGLTPSQLASFPGGQVLLDPSTYSSSVTLNGNPGISAGIQSVLLSKIGQVVAIPIYSSSGGTGSNAWYQITTFAAVRIMAVDFKANPKILVVQPALIYDPTAIPQTDPTQWPAGWSWTSGGVVRLRLSR